MTHDELHAIPEWSRFDSRTEIRDGRKVTIPVMRAGLGAQRYDPDEPMQATDLDGVTWQLVKIDGVQYRVRK